MRISIRIYRTIVMQNLFDQSAPKKPTNLSINSDLLSKSKALNINLSATLENALKKELAKSKSKKWKSQNRAAIQSYNDFVEKNGVFGSEYQEF